MLRGPLVIARRQVPSRPSSNIAREMQTPLYTVGYEGRTISELLDDLVQVGVDRLVDVRELPLSRRPGFSKTALTEALAEVGIEYIHIKPLGNPKPNRERYWSGDIDGGARAYRKLLRNGSYSALRELADSLDDGATCLMCFERDHELCHRDVITESLRALKPGLAVENLS